MNATFLLGDYKDSLRQTWRSVYHHARPIENHGEVAVAAVMWLPLSWSPCDARGEQWWTEDRLLCREFITDPVLLLVSVSLAVSV